MRTKLNQHRPRTTAALLLTGAIILSGCSKQSKPSQSEIERAMTVALPSHLRLDSFEIEVQQNMGNEVEPIWASRFHGTIKLVADTFAPDGTEASKPYEAPTAFFIRAVKHAGDSVPIFGKSLSGLQNGVWQTNFQFDEPLDNLGRPQSAFGTGNVIVRGSKAEQDLLAAKAAAAEAKENEKKKLAAQRLEMLATVPRLLPGKWSAGSFMTVEFNEDSTYVWADSRLYRDLGGWSIEGEKLHCAQTSHNGKPVRNRHIYYVIESIDQQSVTLTDPKNSYSKLSLKRLR